MSQHATRSADGTASDSVVYCVVPARLARIQPRLCEHFAGANVEVVLDKRIGERRSGEAGSELSALDELSDRLTPGMERRTSDGRRAAIPLERPVALPPELRRYERDLRFLAVPAWNGVEDDETPESWRRRAEAAEEQAAALAGALMATADALRERGGMSPRRFRELSRAETAIDRYYRWRVRTEPTRH
jgi:hypothetical protein